MTTAARDRSWYFALTSSARELPAAIVMLVIVVSVAASIGLCCWARTVVKRRTRRYDECTDEAPPDDPLGEADEVTDSDGVELRGLNPRIK